MTVSSLSTATSSPARFVRTADDTFNTLTALKDAIGDKANSVTVNPMNYVQKVVVAYKNPGHNFNTPYISSIYSGMMLDSYA